MKANWLLVSITFLSNGIHWKSKKKKKKINWHLTNYMLLYIAWHCLCTRCTDRFHFHEFAKTFNEEKTSSRNAQLKTRDLRSPLFGRDKRLLKSQLLAITLFLHTRIATWREIYWGHSHWLCAPVLISDDEHGSWHRGGMWFQPGFLQVGFPSFMGGWWWCFF